LNAPGDVLFKALISSRQDGSHLRTGLFLRRKGSIQTVAVDGDPGIDLNLTGFTLALSDDGTVLFFSPGANTVYRFADGRLKPVLAPGWSSRVVFGSRLEWVYQAVPNRAGDVVFHGVFLYPGTADPPQQGIYLLRRDGTIDRIAMNGGIAPAGGHFALNMVTTDRFGGRYTVPATIPLKLNDDGMAVFAAPLTDDAKIPTGAFSTPAGLFSYRRGKLAAIVVDGDSRPDDPAQKFAFVCPTIEFELNDTGLVAFNPSGEGIFVALNGTVAALAVKSGSTGLHEGTEYSIREFKGFRLNGSRTVAFRASICCGTYSEGIFLARPATPPVPNGGFEAPAEAGVPKGWSTWWTNFGTGDVRQYDSAGRDSFD